MHSKLDRFENNEDFIDWLKDQGCSSKITDGILEFNDRDFSVFKERVKKQPDLLTTLVKNGYDSKAINTAFCYGNDQTHDNFLKLKQFIIKFTQNQCPTHSLESLYRYNANSSSKIFQNQIIYIIFFKYFPYLNDKVSYNNIEVKLLNCNKDDLGKLRNNLQLFYLLMTNGILDSIFRTLVAREDFEDLKINDNKELLDFLLDNRLITFDKDKLDFIKNYPLVSSLLKVGDLTIVDLKNKSIEEIQKETKKLSQERILKVDPILEQVSQDVSIDYNKGGIQRLGTYSMAIIVENMQENKLPISSLEEVETASVKATSSGYVIS